MAIAPEVAGSLSILCSRHGGELLVEVRGELDAATAPLLQTRMELETELCPLTVVVDLSEVSFCGSAGIAALVRASKKADECGARFLLRNPSRCVARVLQVTQADRYFEIQS